MSAPPEVKCPMCGSTDLLLWMDEIVTVGYPVEKQLVEGGARWLMVSSEPRHSEFVQSDESRNPLQCVDCKHEFMKPDDVDRDWM